MSDNQLGINGLEWISHSYQDNGGDSYVVPFPTIQPVHVVFHGQTPFNHGHYGLHLGIEDNLTFLGPQNQLIKGYFCDCRKESKTFGIRKELSFSANSKRALRIPAGVAHSFMHLENIFTLNAYNICLPPPDKLLSSENPLSSGADIINFHFDTPDALVPSVEPNPYPASDVFYTLLSALQKETLARIDHNYPFTEDVTFPSGETARILVKEQTVSARMPPEWVPVGEIDGVGWRRHLVVWGDEESGYSALLDHSPLQIIDHGSSHYANDAYGIHLLSEDRLTFVGPENQLAKVHLLDCREDSPTVGKEAIIAFRPSPLRYLCIPPGVAHGFENLQNIFTINRPIRCAGSADLFEPGNDVIDWHFRDRPAPKFRIEHNDGFDVLYYSELARRQKRYLSHEASAASTAMVFLATDHSGEQVRVALRKTV